MARDLMGLMWADALELLERAERAEKSMFRPSRRTKTSCWEPPVDLFETERELWIIVALPGVSKDRLDVRLDHDVFIVTGERPLPVPDSVTSIHRLELPHGRFERFIRLPTGRFEITRRDLTHGCLTIVLRKLPA